MKKLKYLIVLLICLVFVAPTPVAADEAFDITNYKVVMDVTESGRYDITEEISTYFNTSRHGIYRTIPTKYQMSWEIDGVYQDIEYNWPVENIEVYGDNYEVTTYDDSVSIAIGDADRYVSGAKTYKLSYSIQTHDLGLSDGSQMIYFNLIGSDWDTTIANIDLTVNLPATIDGSQINVTSGYYGSTESTKVACTYDADANQIHCTNSATLDNYESVTLYVPLSDDYFNFPTYSQYVYAALLASTLLVALFAFFYFRWGKDEPVITTVEFTAPDGLDSAAVGYIIDSQINDRDITSLILEWGKNGYLEIKDRKYDLVLKKLKDIDDDKPGYEKKLFNALFRDYDEVSTSDLEDSFYVSINECKEGIHKYFDTKERRLFTTQSVFLQVVNCLLIGLPLGLIIGVVRFTQTYRVSSILVGVIPAIIIGVFLGIFMILIRNQWYSMRGYSRVIMLALVGILLAVTLLIYFVLNYAYVPLAYMAVGTVGMLALLYFTTFMSKRTSYGNRVFGQVIGLREFIVSAEEDRLKMLAEDNPYIFYDILPYAYAFGLTKVWQKHFEKLEIPPATFYDSTSFASNYLMIMYLSRSLNSIQSSMVSVPHRSGGGGFGGGGFGGGGGGFSGGGFGGGGGGSW